MDHKIKFPIFNYQFSIFLSAMALYSFLAIFAPTGVWNSPDEMANAFFIEHFASGQGLTVFDPDIVRAGGLIHPRSISVRDGLMSPGSFLGMIIFYALPVNFFGSSVSPFLTPFFTALALVAFGRILKRFITPRGAMLGVLLAMFHPALWYYANRGLFHNVFFLDCVIFAFFFAMVRPFEGASRGFGVGSSRGRIVDALLSSSAFVLALAVRTFEAVWLVPLVLFLLWSARKKIAKETLIVYAAITISSGVFFILISRAVYGSIIASGYGAAELFPFGFSLKNIARNGFFYGKSIFWWYTIIAGAGGAWLVYQRIKNKAPKELWRLLLIVLAISLPLMAIYGSGRYFDTPDPSMVTIGTSTVRYYLPLYIWSIPFGAWFLDLAAKLFKRTLYEKIFLTVVVLIVAVLSFRITFYGRSEGLVYVLTELKRYSMIRKGVLLATPPNALIISDRSDKIFFPYRHVIVGTRNADIISSLGNLNKIGPLFMYSEALSEDDPRVEAYKSAGFPLREHLRFGGERLYYLAPH